MTQEYDTTTERKLWFSGAWGGAYQLAFCNSARIALLATIIAEGLRIVYNNEATSNSSPQKNFFDHTKKN